jgi:hypothetical protein
MGIEDRERKKFCLNLPHGDRHHIDKPFSFYQVSLKKLTISVILIHIFITHLLYSIDNERRYKQKNQY